jgi:hypothetical protein
MSRASRDDASPATAVTDGQLDDDAARVTVVIRTSCPRVAGVLRTDDFFVLTGAHRVGPVPQCTTACAGTLGVVGQ